MGFVVFRKEENSLLSPRIKTNRAIMVPDNKHTKKSRSCDTNSNDLLTVRISNGSNTCCFHTNNFINYSSNKIYLGSALISQVFNGFLYVYICLVI